MCAVASARPYGATGGRRFCIRVLPLCPEPRSGLGTVLYNSCVPALAVYLAWPRCAVKGWCLASSLAIHHDRGTQGYLEGHGEHGQAHPPLPKLNPVQPLRAGRASTPSLLTDVLARCNVIQRPALCSKEPDHIVGQISRGQYGRMDVQHSCSSPHLVVRFRTERRGKAMLPGWKAE